MDKTKFFGSKEATAILGVHPRTLYVWEKKGVIETIRSTPTCKRYYNVEKYLKSQGLKCAKINKGKIKCSTFEEIEKMKKVKICYARVSSIGQKDDLGRQKELLIKKYPVGSGINLTKRCLLKIIELAIEGKLEELVIVHKDRLERFRYELLEFLIKKYSNGTKKIINKKEEIEPEEEMVKDVLQIMNVFVAKMNGQRKYNIKNNKKIKTKIK